MKQTKKIYFFISLLSSNEDENSYTLDFSNVVNSITSIGTGTMIGSDEQGYGFEAFSNITYNGTKLNFTNYGNSKQALSRVIVSGYTSECWFGYDKLLI